MSLVIKHIEKLSYSRGSGYSDIYVRSWQTSLVSLGFLDVLGEPVNFYEQFTGMSDEDYKRFEITAKQKLIDRIEFGDLVSNFIDKSFVIKGYLFRIIVCYGLGKNVRIYIMVDGHIAYYMRVQNAKPKVLLKSAIFDAYLCAILIIGQKRFNNYV